MSLLHLQVLSRNEKRNTEHSVIVSRRVTSSTRMSVSRRMTTLNIVSTYTVYTDEAAVTDILVQEILVLFDTYILQATGQTTITFSINFLIDGIGKRITI